MAEELKKLPWQEIFGNNVPDDDDDIDVWAAFSGPAQHVPVHQAINELSEIEAAIARALVHNGIVIWAGIPEHVVQELENAGYKITKKKKIGGTQRPQ